MSTMKVHISTLHQIVRDYLVQVIVPKMPNNAMQFGVAFVSNYISSNLLTQYLAPHVPLLQAMGIIQDNLIDLDGMKMAALSAIEQCHGSFIVANYKVDKQDIEDLYAIATKYAQVNASEQSTQNVLGEVQAV